MLNVQPSLNQLPFTSVSHGSRYDSKLSTRRTLWT